MGRGAGLPDCWNAAAGCRHHRAATAADEMPKPREGPDAEYGLVAGVDQPPPGSEAYAEHVGINCPVCHTRLHFTLDQVGQTAICPTAACRWSCRLRNPNRRATATMSRARPSTRWAGLCRSARPPVTDRPPKVDRRYLVSNADRPSLPPHPFLSGVFGFPFTRGVPGRCLGFWITGMLIAGLGFFAADTAMQGFGEVVGVPMLALTGFLATWWISALAAIFLAVVNETASGNNRVHAWPELSLIDSIFEGLFWSTAWPWPPCRGRASLGSIPGTAPSTSG